MDSVVRMSKRLDQITDQWVDYLLERWYNLLEDMENKRQKFIAWFLDAIDGEYDESLERDIIVQLYEQKMLEKAS